MTNRSQVSIFFLALLLLEVSGLGSIDLSKGRSNNDSADALNRQSIGSWRWCWDRMYVCLDHQGEPLGQSCVPYSSKNIDGVDKCVPRWSIEAIISKCKQFFSQSTNALETVETCLFPIGKV